MKKQILFYIFLFFIILSPISSLDLIDSTDKIDNISPPNWIFGTWILDDDEEWDVPFIVEFTKDDIIMDLLMDPGSMEEYIAEEIIIAFNQNITEEYYEIYVKFESEEWFKERFFIASGDVMESKFIDSDGMEEDYTYYRN